MILKGKYDSNFIKVLLDKRFFTIYPVLCGMWGYEVRLHINHKKGEVVEYTFNGECDYTYVDGSSNPYETNVCFRFQDSMRFNQPDDVCQYILDNLVVTKYIDKFADDKTISKRLSEKLASDYLS